VLGVGRPGLLLAGILLAGVPLLLHLLTRRPPERAPLPTARFLRPDPRTSVRLERRPTDLALLLLRTLFLLLLSLALAAPTWSPRRSGTHSVVLLDGGRGMAAAWPAAVDSAAGVLAAAGAGAELIVFDTTVRVLDGTAARLDSLRSSGPSGSESRYAAAFEALRRTPARAVAAESARAHLITVPRLGAWTPGFAPLRRAAWPGAIGLLVPAAADSVQRDAAAPGRRTGRVLADTTVYVAAALTVADYDVVNDVDGAAVIFALDGDAARADAAALLERARAGATVVWAGASPPAPLADAPPFAAAGPDATRALPVLFDDGTLLRTASGAALRATQSERTNLAPARPRVVAVWADGRTAALAAPVGAGCLVYAGFALDARETGRADGFAEAVRRLAEGCAGSTAPGAREAGSLPLDAAARAALAGDGAETVALETLAAGVRNGRDLARPLLALALAVALLETTLAYGRGRFANRVALARERARKAPRVARSVGARW
jgi:hypothetical protein